ncbi:response regulator transcription factor [Chloroflexota bacterium]
MTNRKRHIKVLLANDNELTRYGLRCMLEQEEDMEIVGECANSQETVSQIRMLSPYILIMNAHMSGRDGIEVTRYLKRGDAECNASIILLAESTKHQAEALEAGAASYLLKDITCTELTQTIREVYQNKQSSDNPNDLVEEAVKLVIPAPLNAAHLLQLLCQLENRLNEDHECCHASIVHTVGSWDWGTEIIILMRATALTSLVNKLETMPEIEKVQKEPLAESVFPSFTRKFGLLPSSNLNPSVSIRITLKAADIANRKPVTTLTLGRYTPA